MSFYLRKSIKVGPLRFNLSGSGVGVSAGVRGLRFGTGPRGNYVHMGSHGIFYRATIPKRRDPVQQRSPAEIESPIHSHDPLEEIESAEVSEIVDSSSEELLQELDQKRKKVRLFPGTVVLAVVALLLGLALQWLWWLLLLLFFTIVFVSFLAYRRDLLAKTVVLFYDLEPEMETVYSELHQAATELAACSKVWHIEAHGRVRERKYHAGADTVVRRQPTFIRKSQPPFLKTNIETIAIGVGRQTLYLFPDRLLVFEPKGVGAVGYQYLDIACRNSQFVEDGPVPRDAKIIDRTWRYVNKKGGPDRRFKDNPEIPICLYEEISLRSSTGLNEMIQLSRTGVADQFSGAVEKLAGRLDQAGLSIPNQVKEV